MKETNWQFSLGGLIFGLIITGLFLGGITNFQREMDTTYGTSFSIQMNKSFTTYENISLSVVNGTNSLENKTSNIVIENVNAFFDTVRGSWDSLKQTTSSIGTTTTLLNVIRSDVPEFDIVIKYIILLLVAGGLIVILSILAKWVI